MFYVRYKYAAKCFSSQPKEDLFLTAFHPWLFQSLPGFQSMSPWLYFFSFISFVCVFIQGLIVFCLGMLVVVIVLLGWVLVVYLFLKQHSPSNPTLHSYAGSYPVIPRSHSFLSTSFTKLKQLSSTQLPKTSIMVQWCILSCPKEPSAAWMLCLGVRANSQTPSSSQLHWGKQRNKG